MSDDSPHDHRPAAGRLYWCRQGARATISLPGLILVSAFVGFAGLARGAGLTLPETLFMTAVVWALPAQVILIGVILAGGGLFAAAFAVTLSSARLMPMVVAIVPEMRAERTRPWTLYLVSHFVAVTAWVLALERFRHVPRPMRTTFFAGLGTTLVCINLVVIVVVFTLAAKLPPAVSAALFLLTPMYFLTSLWGSARERASQHAMLIGLVLGPVFHLLAPDLDLLGAGLVGGLAAYGFRRFTAREESA